MNDTERDVLACLAAGMTDRATSEKCFCSISTVGYYRELHGIPINPDKRGRPRMDRTKFRILHGIGYNDREIAEKIGVSQSTVQKWRVQEGMESNYRKEESR